MIDIKEILDEFDPVDMQNLNIDYGISGEKAGLAVALYNKALRKMNDGCFDLARIDLRKSVNIYPGFSDAVMLLGICVFASGDRSEAVGIFNSVRDDKRERALDYLDRLHEISLRPESASLRSTVRSSRVPDGVYGNENKLDEIMGKSLVVRSAVDNRFVEDQDYESDDDMKIVPENDSKTVPANNLVNHFDDNGDSEDDEIDVQVLPVDDISSSDEENDEKEVSSADSEDTVEVTVDKSESKSDDIAPYGSIRRKNREQFERQEGLTSRPKDEHRRQAVSGQGDARGTVSEYRRAAEAAEKKCREISAKANRAVANLKIKAARAQVLSIISVLVCLVLVIVLICMGVSNSNLKDKIEKLESGTSQGSGDYELNKKPGVTNTPGNNEVPKDNETLKNEAKASYDSAKALYEQTKYYDAAEILYALDYSLLTDSDRQSAETMYSDAVSKFVSGYYSNFDANSKEGSENWEEMIKYGDPVFKHSPNHNSKGSHLSFLLGKAYDEVGRKYKNSGDETKAEEYFVKAEGYYNNTMTKYPDSQETRNGWASYRLSEMNKIRKVDE